MSKRRIIAVRESIRMMDDLISREAALEALDQIRYALWEIDIPSPTVPEYIEHHRGVQSVMTRIDEIRSKMEMLPSAGGHWEKIGDKTWWGLYECSECHLITSIDYDYCPHCGAKMKGNP